MSKGLLCGVFRDAGMGDCTNGGISASHDNLILLDTPEGGPFEPRDKTPGIQYEVWRGYKRATTGPRAGAAGPMFGGNFLYTSDSRFPSDYPIPIHDRYETAEEARGNG